VASTVGAGFTTPGTSRGLLSVFSHRYLLSRIVRKEVEVRYRGSLLGWIWSYAKPGAQFLIYWLVIGVFLGAGRPGTGMEAYPVYLFSGLILLNFFNEAFGNATRSLTDNAALIKKIYMPREIFPVASTLIAFVNFLPQLAILILVSLVVGWHPTPLALLGVLVAILIIAVLATGLGMFFGAINVSFRDSQNFVDLIIMIATWGSPVLYATDALDKLPGWLGVVYDLNPITPAVELMHGAFWSGVLKEPADSNYFTWYTLIAAVLSLAILLLGQTVFRRLEGRFAQDL